MAIKQKNFFKLFKNKKRKEAPKFSLLIKPLCHQEELWRGTQIWWSVVAAQNPGESWLSHVSNWTIVSLICFTGSGTAKRKDENILQMAECTMHKSISQMKRVLPACPDCRYKFWWHTQKWVFLGSYGVTWKNKIKKNWMFSCRSWYVSDQSTLRLYKSSLKLYLIPKYPNTTVLWHASIHLWVVRFMCASISSQYKQPGKVCCCWQPELHISKSDRNWTLQPFISQGHD